MGASGSAVFGPVASRRLGLSLGIDLLDFKTCSLNCVYCELGLTSKLISQRGRFRDYREVLKQVETRLAELKTAPDSLTLAGSGEPTLHVDLGKTLEGLARISPIRKVVLTNSTLMHLPDVRKDLLHADLIVPSLDAVSPDVFARINQPAFDLNPAAMLEGLVCLRDEFRGDIWLEILLVAGINDTEEELDKLRAAVARIRPDILQLNTIVRPPAVKGFAPVATERLHKIAATFNVPVEVAESSLAAPSADQAEFVEIIIQTTRMRPCTVEDLAQISGLAPANIKDMLEKLQSQGRVASNLFDGRTYYRGAQ